jgi:ABC-type lipoprotein export system ATPase subunit
MESRPSAGGSPAVLIELKNLVKVYGQGEAQVRALDGVNLHVKEGEFIAVMGPSGSGKSTAMNIIGCLDRPTSGSYLYRGVELGCLDRKRRALFRRNYLGFVFQGFNLLARTTAIENVELPLIYRGMGFRERRKRAIEALDRVGLKSRALHAPSQLSGGQQQRVAIARAIVANPSVLLADEPTGNVDTKTSHEIMNLLVSLNREQGITILMVTHEPDTAAYSSRLVHFLDGRIDSDTHDRAAA